MEAEKYYCPGCGALIPADRIDFKTRTAYCDFCCQTIRFPKQHSHNSPSLSIALEETLKLFMAGNVESAKSEAETVLSLSSGNPAAHFVISYYKAYIAEIKSSSVIKKYFETTWKDALFEIEEEEMCKQMLLKTVLRSAEFEEQILGKLMEYDDPKEMADFIEKFSPTAISTRRDIRWFTPAMASIYKELTLKCNLPKTWYALYSVIRKNPDSPLFSNDFFLKTKTRIFYEDYLLKVGDIFSGIKDERWRKEFNGAFLKLKKDFEAKMQQ